MAGDTNSSEISQQYTLQAAAPQFIPGPGTFAYAGTTTTSPSISTATNGTDVQIRYTIGTAVPTCQTATLLQGPYPATLDVDQNITYNAIACKPGFAQSTVTSAPYIVQENQPSFDQVGGLYDHAVAVTVSGPATAPGGSWVCYSTAGAAGCGATASTCATGSVNPATTQPTVTTNGTVIDALTCAPANFNNSGHVQSGTYVLQLAPVSFTPNGGSLGTGGTQNVVIAMTDQANGIQYTNFCTSNDGTDPVCDTASDTDCTKGDFTAVTAKTTTATEVADATHTTIKAIACPGTQTADANKGFLASPAGQQAVFSPAGTLTTPTINPGTSTQNNTVTVSFDNGNAVAVNICYTTNGSAPSVTGVCAANNAATHCVAATAGQTGVAATGNPIVTLNQTKVTAIACDPTQAVQTSPPNSATYTLQEATPTITPNTGSVSVGSVITFADATNADVGGLGAGHRTTFHFVTNGGPVNCTAGSGTSVEASGTANAQGLFTATYTIQGNETTIAVIACDPAGNFIPAASTATASFTYRLVTPTFLFPTGTYDDVLDGNAGAGTTEQVQVQAGSSAFTGTTWLCSGTSPACGTTANACATGGGAAITTAAPCTNAQPGTCFNDPVSANGTTLNVVACALPSAGAVASPAVIQSPAASAALTLAMSPIGFTPAPGASSGTVTPTAQLVGGSITTPSAITTASAGARVLICVSATQPVPPQPVPCSSFGGIAGPDWTCFMTSTGTAFVTAASITTNTTYNAFACKDGIPYATSSGNAYTFTPAPPYSHTITTTGLVTDFTAAAEEIATTGGTSNAFVSYNGTNLWVGFDSPAVVGTTPGYVHFYIGGTAGGAVTADNAGPTLGGSLPVGFQGLYHVYWKNDGTSTAIDHYNGSNWVTTTLVPTVTYNGGASTFVEFQIPLSSIGNPTQVHLLGGVSQGTIIDVWPTGGPNGGNLNGVNFTDWQTDVFSSSANPNATANLDKP
jgi:hypothetical protein